MTAADPRVTDAALAAGTTAAVLAAAALIGPLTWHGTWPLAATLGLLLLARRRWPVAVLLLTAGTIIGLGTAGLTGIGWLWPALPAYLTAARAGHTTWAYGTAAAHTAVALTYDVVTGGPGAATTAEILLLVAALAVAAARDHRRRLHAAVEEHTHRQTAAAERLHIAGELHDVVAHTLTVVGVHLRVAAEALTDLDDTRPGGPAREARDAVATAQQVRAAALTDLRALIGVLRDPADPAAPTTAGLDLPAALDDLLRHARAAGLTTALHADPGDLPAPVALAVHRIVREALTNTVRHAAATTVTVHVRRTGDAAEVTVTDDGTGRAAPPGHGIAGMRERATALGGTLTAGPAGPGWAVRATLPLTRRQT